VSRWTPCKRNNAVVVGSLAGLLQSHDERLTSSWAFPIVSKPDIVFAMSHVRRLRLGDRIFFATVSRQGTLPPFTAAMAEPRETPACP